MGIHRRHDLGLPRVQRPLTIIRAHAYGNDFLLVSSALVPDGADRPALARALCDRHRGLGGDGLIIHRDGEMSLLNADGSYS